MIKDDLGAIGETKPFWQSKTMWGAGIGTLGMIAGAIGYQIDPATQQVLIDQSYAAVMAVSALVGTVLVVVGRLRADKAVSATKS